MNEITLTELNHINNCKTIYALESSLKIRKIIFVNKSPTGLNLPEFNDSELNKDRSYSDFKVIELMNDKSSAGPKPPLIIYGKYIVIIKIDNINISFNEFFRLVFIL